MKSALACFACGATDAEVFFEARGVPTHNNRLLATRELALAAPVADIDLCLCPDCGLVFNGRFDAELLRYALGYENSLHNSGAFQTYAENLARHLIRTYDLHNKHVLEVGCGRGEFLRLICEFGSNRGIGFDPSAEAFQQQLPGGGQMRIVRDDCEANWPVEEVDLVLCRHVLEHLDRPAELLETIRVRGPAAVFFEVPDLLYTLREGGIWDLLYEHCSYFAPTSLAALFRRCGFAPGRVDRVYGGQFLTIEARVGPSEKTDETPALDELLKLTSAFAALHKTKLESWREKFDQCRRAGQRLAVWGAGTKGVTFVNTFPEAGDLIVSLVDRNPKKRGCFVPVSGHPIVSPADLRASGAEVVVVMNPLYQGEIRDELGRMGLESEVWTA